jgi:hypothetical protein
MNIVLVLIVAVLTAGLAGGQTSSIVLSSPGIEVRLSPANGYGIESLRDPASGRQFAAAGANAPLYRITLWRRGRPARDITSKDAKLLRQEVTGEAATLVFAHEAEKLTVTCTGRIDRAAPRVNWKIRVDNEGQEGVRSIFYPQWIAPAPLSGDGAADRILFPFLDGQEFTEPSRHFKPGQSTRIAWPGQACIQLVAYHDGRHGLMEMTRDGDGWVKHFRALRTESGFDLSVEHNPGEAPGLDLDLPYETSLEVFQGDWQEAADRYKAWGVRQKWAQQTLRKRLPAWLAAAPPIVTYAMRGDPYAAEWSMYFPPSNRLINPDFHPAKIPALTGAYAEFFGSPIITNPFGWEKIAPWIAGEYFPPIGGEELWRKTADAVRAGGHRLFLLLSGARWGVNMDNAGYHNYEAFLRDIAPKAAAYSPEGKPGEEHPPWASSVQLCHGAPFTQAHLAEIFLGCVKLGASMVQHDQNHGGMAFVCYHPDHPHPPGYGRWMVERVEELFRTIRTEGRKIDPEFALSVEEPCEYFMPYWETYMGRPYNFFGTGSDPSSYRRAVPLFIYVYHEYLLGYGGSNEIDIAHPYAEAIKVARKFTNGTLLEVDPGKPAYRLDAIPSPTEEMRLARSCARALRGPARDYLVFGRMLRDPEMPGLRRERIRMWRDPRDPRLPFDLPAADVPVVLYSTWEADGKVAYVFANWQTSDEPVTLVPRACNQKGASFRIAVHGESGLRNVQESGPLPREVRVTAPALSAVVVEQVVIQ